jgi:hypothetical protein
LTSRNDDTGLSEAFVQTILMLTDDELVIRDENRHAYRIGVSVNERNELRNSHA